MNVIRDFLHKTNPYHGFVPKELLLKGWGSDDPNFKTLIGKVQPKEIWECGTWLGKSAIHMATLAPEANVTCIDTWLGAAEFWYDHSDNTRYGQLELVNGYPSVYYQFLSNVVQHNYQDRITPFPTTTSIAAEVFTKIGVKADLIYLDASHSIRDVFQDLICYYPLLNSGGVLFGDDWGIFPGIELAVKEFCSVSKVNYELFGRQWVITP